MTRPQKPMAKFFRATGFLALGLVLGTADPVFGALGQCGGEGPTPIVDQRVTPRYQAVSTTGSVLEYAVSDATNEVFYRTDTKELYRTTIGSTASTKISDAPYPLSRIVGKKGAYLTTEPDGYFWNVGKSTSWTQMTLSAVPVQSHFWESEDLYLVKEQDDPFGTPSFQFIRYRAGDSYSTTRCGLIPANGWGYTMATGGGFPYIYFYKTNARIGGNQLSLYRFDLRSCMMNPIVTYRSPIPGNVKWVHWFQGSNTVAVATDHSSKNLLYDQGNGICHYFDLGGDEPVITNPKIPTIAVVRASNSADLINLQTGKKNSLTSASNYYNNLRWSDFYLTSDSKTLFVAPESSGTRELIQIRVKP